MRTECDYWGPHNAKGPWRVCTSWIEQAGRWECVGFAIDLDTERSKEYPPPYKIGAELFRRVPVGDLVMRHRRRLAAPQEAAQPSEYVRGDDELHYSNVAVVYHVAWSFGRRPTKAVQEEFGVSRATASRWVQEARRRRYLAPATQGKASGEFGSEPLADRLPRWIGGIPDLPPEEQQAEVDRRIVSDLRHDPTIPPEQREKRVQRYLAWVEKRDRKEDQ